VACGGTVLMAQPVFIPSSPALSASPSSPAISPTPVFVQDNPALTGGAVSTNAGGTTATSNLTAAMVSAALTNLEATVQATLPIIAAFNDNVALGGVGPASGNTSISSAFLSSSLAATNTAAQSTNAVRATVQAMILLQGELENAAAALTMLNGTTNSVTATNTVPGMVGTFTNAFGF